RAGDFPSQRRGFGVALGSRGLRSTDRRGPGPRSGTPARKPDPCHAAGAASGSGAGNGTRPSQLIFVMQATPTLPAETGNGHARQNGGSTGAALLDRPIPTSSGQRRLWFLEQMEPGSPLYNIPYLIRLSGELNERALDHALAAIVERH